jgi:hypothetical protein
VFEQALVCGGSSTASGGSSSSSKKEEVHVRARTRAQKAETSQTACVKAHLLLPCCTVAP